MIIRSAAADGGADQLTGGPAMTIQQAEQIRDEYAEKTNPTDEELFEFTEAMNYLIEERQSPRDMLYLGGVYYDLRDFDLALKYYERAASYGDLDAYVCLGYIWYYGRTGEKDYEKAFRYYSKAADLGDIVSAYKVADMYKNGYYVQKDYGKYAEIIKELYPKVKNARYIDDPLPEVYTRLAGIYTEEGRVSDAVRLYLEAKDFLAQRIAYNPFFGNLSIMKWLIDDLYELISLDEETVDFFDLYYLLKEPCTVTFEYCGMTLLDDFDEDHEPLTVEVITEDGENVIKFGDKWFRTREDFFAKAEYEGERLVTLNREFCNFEVTR